MKGVKNSVNGTVICFFQVIQLHKELLLMGELQQKCQEKLQSQKIAGSAKHEHEYIQTALKAEIKGEYRDHSIFTVSKQAFIESFDFCNRS